jgi:spore coat protein U-like protein
MAAHRTTKNISMQKTVSFLSLAFLVLFFAVVANAGSKTANLRVTATVANYCTVSATPVSTGTVTSAGEITANAKGHIIVNCPLNQSYHVALDAGQQIGGASQSDSDYANIFPEGSSLVATGTGSDRDHRVYGSLSGFSDIPAGTVLHDIVTVSIHY